MNRTLEPDDLTLFFSLITKGEVQLIYDDLTNELQINGHSKATRVKVISGESEVNDHNFDFMVGFGPLGKIPGFYTAQFYFITHPDGKVLWFFPKSLKYPTFLNFINSSSFKHILKRIRYSFFMVLGLHRFISQGSFIVYSRDKLWLYTLVEQFDCKNFSLYTGVPGPNRKMILELNQGGQTLYFIKKWITSRSKELIKNEFKNLNYLSDQKFSQIKVPRCGKLDPGYLLVENIKPPKQEQYSYFESLHLNALSQIYKLKVDHVTLSETHFWKEINEKMLQINPHNSLKFWIDIYNSLSDLKNSINTSVAIPVAYGHMDFTPWNMFVSKQVLYLYDWEAGITQAPLFYDAFHFIFHSGTILRKSAYNVIKEELVRLKNQSLTKFFMELCNVDFELHYKLYLLYSISNALYIIQNQDSSTHSRIVLFLENWMKALFSVSGGKKEISDRKIFVINFFSEPFTREYAVLGFMHTSILKLPDDADLNILVRKITFPAVLDFVKSQTSIRKLRLIKMFNKNIVELFFFDGGYLKITFNFNFWSKGFYYLNAKEVLKNAWRNDESVLMANPADSFEFIFIPMFLRRKSISKEYNDFYQQQTDEIKSSIIQKLNAKYQLTLKDFDTLFSLNEEIHAQIVNSYLKFGMKKIDLKFKIQYFFFYLKTKFSWNGIVISFTGVDGSAKSAVISEFAELIKTKYNRNCIILDQGPSFFTLYRTHEMHQEIGNYGNLQKLTRFLWSILKFLLILLDYTLGQTYIWIKYILRGYVVIYDRFYFDFIVNQQYTNLLIGKKVIQWCYRFIFKPRLNVFVYARPDVLAERDNTINAVEVEQCTSEYIELFHNLSVMYKKSRYFTLENNELKITIENIEREFGKVV